MSSRAAPAHPMPLSPHREFTFRHAETEERIIAAVATAADLPALDAAPAGWLSERERARVSRAVAKRREEFVLGRYAAKTALAAWHRHAELGAFTVLPGAFEQPVIEEPGRADVTLAHTAGVAIAIAHERGHPMGVDVECVDPARLDVLRTQVAASELPAGREFPEVDALFLLWSAKEALSKALRCGLTCPFEVLAATGAHAAADGVLTGNFRNFGQYQFVAWRAERRAFAWVASRNARLDPVLPALVRFTREAAAVAAPGAARPPP